MKKSLIALAVAGALTAPMIAQADATLYGSMRLYVSAGDNQDLDTTNDASRMGLKGTVDTSIEGVKAVYHLEAFIGRDNGLDGNTQNEASFGVDGRLAYVGLTGDFGTVAAGQQWTPMYSFVTSATDLTINSTGETHGVFRADSAVAYVSPNMSGLTVAAVVVADREQATANDADAYQLAAKYSMEGLTLAAGMHSVDGNGDIKALSAKYSIDALTLSALYQDFNATDTNPYELGAVYAMGDTTLVGTYYNRDNAADQSGVNIEVRQKLTKQVTAYANFESDENVANENSYGVGLRVDF
ncbi:MAG: porin [Pontibacterium sp.]